jgi:hypothetical protein
MAKKPALAEGSATRTPELPAVEAWDEVPAFGTEAEEAEFWATHSLGKSILDQEFEEDPQLGNRSENPMGTTHPRP